MDFSRRVIRRNGAQSLISITKPYWSGGNLRLTSITHACYCSDNITLAILEGDLDEWIEGDETFRRLVLMATDEYDWEAENVPVYPERLNESLTHFM